MVEEHQETPLFTSSCIMDREKYLKMNQELNGSAIRMLCTVVLLILTILGDTFLMSGKWKPGLFFIFLGIVISALIRVLYIAAVKRSYSSGKAINGTKTQYSFYKEYFTAKSPNSSSQYKYADLYRVVEGEQCFYLMVSIGRTFVVEKSEEQLTAFLRQFVKPSYLPSKKLRNAMCLFLFFGMGLLTFYSVIDSFLPKDCRVKSWVDGVLFFSLLILQIAVILSVAAVVRNKARKLAYKIVFTLVCCIVVLLMGGAIIISWSSEGDIKKNANGTYAVFDTTWSNHPSYQLYEDSGLFYIHYLRSMTGPDDDDPGITESEWQKLQQKQNEAVSGNERQASSNADSDQTAESTDTTTQAASDKVSDGYKRIIDSYFPDTAEQAQEEISAKGDSYYVVKEDDNSVTFLVYDRDSKNGQCGLYVLETAAKDTDGSYSSSDAQIDDIDGYEYSTGKTVQSGKHSWSEAGSQEYRDLTGE